jgi:hypothetical protein
MVDGWTATSNGEYSPKPYYLRLTKHANPDQGELYNPGDNHDVAEDQRKIVVPGPRDPLYLPGAELQAQYPVSVVVDGVGLNITVMSYLDHLDFVIVAVREHVDDVWSMLDGLRQALDELAAATSIKQPAS